MTGQAMTANRKSTQGKLTGWHVLWIMMGFFGVMFVVNGIFLYHAITSFPGEDVKRSYLQGLDYNHTLEEKAAQDRLGWSAAAGLHDGHLVFNLVDADGRPLSAHLVTADLRRGASNADDLVLTLEPLGSGEYVADVSDLPQGRWDAKFMVYDATGEDIVFRASKRIILVP